MIMKRIYDLIVGACLLLPLFTACEKDLPVYDNSQCWLKFDYERDADSLINYSFAYGPSDVMVDTIKIKVKLMGNPEDYDRPITLEQVMTGENDAVVGEHYVPFDDSELMQKYYFIPKNAIQAEVPIVLKRSASLKNANYTLKITFKSTDVFAVGSKERSIYRIVIADQLVKPNGWNSTINYFFGTYSQAKHQFLIDTTGKKWDDDYLAGELQGYVSGDQNYIFWLNQQLRAALEEYERVHGEPLYEDEGKTIKVTFPVF